MFKKTGKVYSKDLRILDDQVVAGEDTGKTLACPIAFIAGVKAEGELGIWKVTIWTEHGWGTYLVGRELAQQFVSDIEAIKILADGELGEPAAPYREATRRIVGPSKTYGEHVEITEGMVVIEGRGMVRIAGILEIRQVPVTGRSGRNVEIETKMVRLVHLSVPDDMATQFISDIQAIKELAEGQPGLPGAPLRDAARKIIGTGRKDYANDLHIVEHMVIVKADQHHGAAIFVDDIAHVKAYSSIVFLGAGMVEIETRYGKRYTPFVSKSRAREFVSDVRAMQELAQGSVQ